MPLQPPRRIYTTPGPRSRSQGVKDGKRSTAVTQGPPLLYGEEALRAMEPIYASATRPPFWDRTAKAGLQMQRIIQSPTITTVKEVTPLIESIAYMRPSAARTAPSPKTLVTTSGGFGRPTFGGKSIFGLKSNVERKSNYGQKSDYLQKPNYGQKSNKSTGFGRMTDDNSGAMKFNLRTLTREDSDLEDVPKKPFDLFASRSQRGGTSRFGESEDDKSESDDDRVPDWGNAEFRRKAALSRKKQYWARKEYDVNGINKKLSKEKVTETTADNFDFNFPMRNLFISDAYQMDAQMTLKNANKLIMQSAKLRKEPKLSESTEAMPKEKVSKSEPGPEYKSTAKGTFRYEARKEALLKRGYRQTDIDEFLLGKDWKQISGHSDYVPSILTPRARVQALGSKTGSTTFGAFDPKLRQKKSQGQAGQGKNLVRTPHNLSGDVQKPAYPPYLQGRALTKPLFGPNPKNMISKERSSDAIYQDYLEIKRSSSFDIGSAMAFSPNPLNQRDLQSTKNVLERRFKEVITKEVQEITKLRNNSKASSANRSFIERLIQSNRPKPKPKSTVRFQKGKMGRPKTPKRSKSRQKKSGRKGKGSKASTADSNPESKANESLVTKDENKEKEKVMDSKEGSDVGPKEAVNEDTKEGPKADSKEDSKERPKEDSKEVQAAKATSKKTSSSKTKKSSSKTRKSSQSRKSSKAYVVDSLEDLKKRLVNPRTIEIRKKIKMNEIGKVTADISKTSGRGTAKDGERILSMERVSILPVLIPFNTGIPQIRTPASGPFEVAQVSQPPSARSVNMKFGHIPKIKN